MMKYSIQRANGRFMNKAYIYFALAFLIAIGTGILFISLSNLESEKALYRKTYKDLQDTTLIIEPSEPGIDSISYDQYLYLKDKYKGKMELYYSAKSKVSFMPADEDLISLDCVFITDDEMKELSNLNFEGGLVIGRSALEFLEKLSKKKPTEKGEPPKAGEYMVTGADIRLKGDKIFIGDHAYTYKVIDSKYETRIISYKTDMLWSGTAGATRLGYSLFLPVEIVDKYKDFFDAKSFLVRVAINEDSPNSNNLWEIMDYLARENHEVGYKMNDQLARIKDRLSQMTWNARRYRILSLLLIALVSIASSGLFYIIFYRRKRDIAVSIALGSTFKRQAIELLIEISYVVIFGLILGISGGSMMADILKMEFTFEPLALLITFIVSIAIIFISAFLSINSLKKLSPIGILQNE